MREQSIQEDQEKGEEKKLSKLVTCKWIVRDSLGSWLVISIKGKEKALHCSPVDVGYTLQPNHVNLVSCVFLVLFYFST